MRRKDVGRHKCLDCFFKVELVFRHKHTDAFQCQKCRVALIHMRCTDIDTKGAQRTYATYAKDDFLFDTHVLVAAIERRRYASVFLGILGDIRVEQIEARTSHFDFPNGC